MQQTLPKPLSLHADAPAAPAPATASHEAHAHDAHEHSHPERALDRFGAFLGFACAVHCISVPLLIGVLPAMGLGFLADHAFDLAIVVIATIAAFFAARSGWRAHHDRRVMAGFGVAVALLFLGLAVGEESMAGRVPSILGGFTLAVTHIANLRLSKHACAH